ncbi:hypothetical protein [uncultured Paludibaculum sp.]|uniref:DUF4097 family beta strand repeat-containing protein n=1 Tax=uncultured Paludibaculum sp. TaxID=1765020 RepID=UPI002AABBBF4|nr:hypothetical protein [uncultured Paludibaculum sp.]
MTIRVFALLGLAPMLMAAGLEEKQTIQKTLPEARKLEVDTVWGPIRVTGYDGHEVRVKAVETVRADSQEDLELARKEVKLEIGQQGDTDRIYVDGPFRCHCDDGRWSGQRSRRHYVVHYDFELQVPRQMAVSLSTVNEGGISMSGVNGDFEIHNVNGTVDLSGLAGSGTVRTVNGHVKAEFTRNPKGQTAFKTINGPIELYFRPGLSADLRLKTFNGKIYSDFEMTALPARPVVSERREGKSIFRADRYSGGRIGGGGPEIEVDGFNSEIRILESK